jgi:hypothetical protein
MDDVQIDMYKLVKSYPNMLGERSTEITTFSDTDHISH